jgi:hypothetical protein
MIFRRKLRTPHLYGTQQQRTAQSRCRLSDIGSHDRLAWLRVRQTVNRMSCNYVFEYQRAYEDALSSSLNTRISASSHTPVQRLARTRRSSASAVRSAALARVRHGHLQPQQKHAVWRLRRRLHPSDRPQRVCAKEQPPRIGASARKFYFGTLRSQRT